MPAWVLDDDVWNRAKKAVEESKGKTEDEFTDQDWGLVTHIYKNMGGRIGGGKTGSQSETFYNKKYLQFAQNLTEALNVKTQEWSIVPKDTLCAVFQYSLPVNAFIKPVLLVTEDNEQYLAEEFKVKMLSIPVKLVEGKFNPIKSNHPVLTQANKTLLEYYTEEKDPVYLRANFLLAKGIYKHNLTEFFSFVKSQKDKNGAFSDLYMQVGKNLKLTEAGSLYV